MKVFNALSRVLTCLVQIDRDIAHSYGPDKRLVHVLPVPAAHTVALLEAARNEAVRESMESKEELAMLRAALRPFAEAYREWEGIGADNLTLRQAHAETPDTTDDKPVTVEHLRAAWEAMK